MSVTSLLDHKRSAMMEALEKAPADARILLIVCESPTKPQSNLEFFGHGWGDPLAILGALQAVVHGLCAQFGGLRH